MSDSDPTRPKADFDRDVGVDKPGIVGARWWQQSLVAEPATVNRRKFLVGLAIAGGALATITIGAGIAEVAGSSDRTPTTLVTRDALEMQKLYGWDFGARGVPLVFDGVAEAPFERTTLDALAGAMTPVGSFAKHQVSTLVESLFARPSATLPDPRDGLPPPDGAPFRRLADVIMPVVTPAMLTAYRIGEALARLCAGRKDVAVLVDLPGPEAVAFAAGAAAAFEPILLLDNWPHPHGVVPSHLALAAMAYYQPRFARPGRLPGISPPLFVLDRARLSAYSEESDRFDNRYYARMPSVAALAKEGIRGVFYVVPTTAALPEPADLDAALSARPAAGEPGVEVRALVLTDFGADEAVHYYGGSAQTDATFWDDYSLLPEAERPVASSASGQPSSAKEFRFAPDPSPAARPLSLGKVAVVATTTGLILSAALDRRGSMNRFSGGYGG